MKDKINLYNITLKSNKNIIIGNIYKVDNGYLAVNSMSNYIIKEIEDLGLDVEGIVENLNNIINNINNIVSEEEFKIYSETIDNNIEIIQIR